MVPQSIQQKLAGLRQREMLLRACWGTARCLAVLVVSLALAWAIDYLIDRRQDTPWTVRVMLFLLQLATITLTAFFWIVRPLLRRPSESDLALLVEQRMPHLRHRLVTAVQLNQPGARTEGMSPELIAVVTREAQKQTAQAHFAAVADPRRFCWALSLGGPVVVAALTAILFVPLAPILVARQFLVDLPIPRNIYLESSAPEKVWLSGEPLVLEFKVAGKGVADNLEGELRVDPVDAALPSEWYSLAFSRWTAEG